MVNAQLQQAGRETPIFLSIILPVYNEEENVPIVHAQLREVIATLERPTEVIFIDDGSTDRSYEILKRLAESDPTTKVIRFRRNFGQTAAISAGVDYARGEVIISMDADLQNDPKDIPRLLASLDEGYDVVSGWRKHRHDTASRRIPSQIANRLISTTTGVHLHDYGCTLKAYRREVFSHARLYGEMHRFIPVYAYWAGARIAELEVIHHPRIHGKSKYGIWRTVKVLLDLITVKFLSTYSTKPIYFFGSVGFCTMGGGVVSGILVLYHKWVRKIYAHRSPYLLLAVFLFLTGLIFVMLGLLAETLMRTWYESQGKRAYTVRESVNTAPQQDRFTDYHLARTEDRNNGQYPQRQTSTTQAGVSS
jgi:glycosyltransferase involved in cell wall biosynthesis